MVSKYWHAKDPLMKIPNLAIHLTTERNKFEPNTEQHLKPILASAIIDQLFGEEIQAIGDDKYQIEDKHFKTLTGRISKDLGIERASIVDFELNAIDSQPACLFGLHKEFISSARIDNLISSLTSIDSLIESHHKSSKDNAEVSMLMLFDHEEIGSQSMQGADSNMLVEVTERVFGSVYPKFTKEDYFRSIRRSLLVSADMAHSVHPNYSDKHQGQHQPKIHNGIVLKQNCNQRYATDTIGASIIRTIAEKAGVPLQDFIVKNDSPCGTTIGPIMAAKAGVKTVDIGAPQLSMHSIRETCGVVDLLYYQRLFFSFYENYGSIPTDLISE